jgi:thymidylate synthase (FAD)
MQVKLIAHTEQPERVVAAAAKCCYSKKSVDELFDSLTDEQVTNMVTHLLTAKHSSPIEHASFTFSVEGVSRALTHQLVRHRLASYSQQSQRYVEMTNGNYVVPPSIINGKAPSVLLAFNQKQPQPKEVYFQCLKALNDAYGYLVNKCNIPKEDARYLLPNATQSNITITMNAAELYHFFELRLCTRAQWEIREMAALMLTEVKKVAPLLFSKAGASCIRNGYCTEGKQSCGKCKTLEEILVDTRV